MRVLDLFCGLGGFSQAFLDRGHRVVRIDIIPPATVLADVRALPIRGKWDVLLASPPCTEFSREDMPWHRTGNPPSLELVEAARAAIAALSPRWWAIENVRGARRYLGLHRARAGSRYLWGNFPLFRPPQVYGKWRLPPTPDRARLRSMIPYELSSALCRACEEAICDDKR